MGELHPIDAAVLGMLGQLPAFRTGNSHALDAGSRHWKRVAKDRARRKAAKKHKQHMRRSGR